MSITSSELFHRMKSVGLANESQCAQWMRRCTQELPPDRVTDGTAVAAALVQQKILSPYQMEMLLGSMPDRLRVENWVIVEPVADPMWLRWFVLRPTGAETPDAYRWGRWVDSNELQQLRDCRPSLNRALRLTQLAVDQIYRVEMPMRTGQGLLLVVEPMSERPLWEWGATRWCPDERQKVAWSVRLIESVASALQCLHEIGLVHGRVLPDRITWDGENARLICDPLCEFTLPVAHNQSGTIGSGLTREACLQFAPPEFLAPTQRPTPATDVFNVACLWWWLLYGRPPVSGNEPTKILQAQMAPPPEFPAQPELPEPLRLVLMHGMARRVSARFADATAFLSALREAKKLAESGATGAVVPPKHSSGQQPVAAENVASTGGQPVGTSAGKPARQQQRDESQRSGKTTPAPPAATKPAASPATVDAREASGKAASSKEVANNTRQQSKKVEVAASAPARPSQTKQRNHPQQEVAGDRASATPTEPPSGDKAKRVEETEVGEKTTPEKDKRSAQQPEPLERAAAKKQTRIGSSPAKSFAQDKVSVPAPPSSREESAKPPAGTRPTKSVPDPAVAIAEGNDRAPTAEKQSARGRAPAEGKSKTGHQPPPKHTPQAAVSDQSTGATAAAGPQAQSAPRAEQAGGPGDSAKTAKEAVGDTPDGDRASVRAASKVSAIGSGKPAATAAARPTRSPMRRRKRQNPRWLFMVASGCGFLIVLLLILKFSGALDSLATNSRSRESDQNIPPEVLAGSGTPVVPERVKKDPRTSAFRIVDAEQNALWLPPSLPRPIQIDLVPPGAQVFVSLAAKRILFDPAYENVRAPIAESIESWRTTLEQQAGISLDKTERVLLALYPPKTPGGVPVAAVRIQLESPLPIEQLRQLLNADMSAESADGLAVLTAGQKTYLCRLSTTDPTLVEAFAVGASDLMREAVEMGGAAGPLVGFVEQLYQRSCEDLDCVILAAVPFLFTEGRGMLDRMPPRLKPILEDILRREARSALIQTSFVPQWYFEVQLVGGSSSETSQLLARLQAAVQSWPNKVEDWFVSESPHPYWRALAIRYPLMLRILNDYARFGVENSAAIANLYLPTEAAMNIGMASWIALHEQATYAGQMTPETGEPAAKPLTVEEYLARPIRVYFDQESIENALQLVAETANDGLPPGTDPLRFELDGDAFELAGITRNQQLRNYMIDNQPVRDALTLIAKMGNPVTTVTDTSEPDQKLIWVVKDDPANPGKKMISLTTRDAATAAGIPLPEEFAPKTNTEAQ